MNLKLLRYSPEEDKKKSTYGFLLDATKGIKFLCHTLEDPYQEKKIYGNTRIPNGRYKIELREEGGMHKTYSYKYADIHRGMLWLKDVPEFEYIYIHVLNTTNETKGCIGVGNGVPRDNQISRSRFAYQIIYPLIAEAILLGEEVDIEISNLGMSL